MTEEQQLAGNAPCCDPNEINLLDYARASYRFRWLILDRFRGGGGRVCVGYRLPCRYRRHPGHILRRVVHTRCIAGHPWYALFHLRLYQLTVHVIFSVQVEVAGFALQHLPGTAL